MPTEAPPSRAVTISPIKMRIKRSELMNKLLEVLRVPDSALLGSRAEVQAWLGTTVIDIEPQGRWRLKRSDMLLMVTPIRQSTLCGHYWLI